jgi:ferredoxin
MAQMTRKIVEIDETKCNGCGLCIPNCHEGAIQIVDGKARLVGDKYCDGLGACLGHCPQGAIRIVERPAEVFDEDAVKEKKNEVHPQACPATGGSPELSRRMTGGCPSARAMDLTKRLQDKDMPARGKKKEGVAPSALRNWPVQLALVPVSAPYLEGADLLLSADCVGFSHPDFHGDLLSGKVLLVACPKLDDAGFYIGKLTEILQLHDIHSLTVARMEVPCCGGLNMIVEEALARAGKEVPVETIIVTIEGVEKHVRQDVRT